MSQDGKAAMEPRKLLLLALNFISILLFAGTIFGWSSLSQILIKERFYSELCDDPRGEPCDAQLVALNKAFTLASTATGMCALPGGWLLDTAGPFWTILTGGTIQVISLIGIALCEREYRVYHIDIFPVLFVGVAVGGALIRFCGYWCGFLFKSHTALLIALASVLFDGSCMVFPVVKVLYDSGVSFPNLFWSYVAIAVIVFTALPLAWKLNDASMVEVWQAQKRRQVTNSSGLDSKPISRQIFSLEFVVILSFSMVQVPRANLYLGTVDSVNSMIADNSHASQEQLYIVNRIVAFAVPLGFVALPAITASIRHYGNAGSLMVTNCLGAAVSLLQLLPSLYMQVPCVCIFACYRAFLFSNIPQFNACHFGVLSMGRIQGGCLLMAGLVNLLQEPLLSWVVYTLDGNFIPLLSLMLIAILVPATPCMWLILRTRKQRRDRLLSAASDALGVSMPPIHADASLPMRSAHGSPVCRPISDGEPEIDKKLSLLSVAMNAHSDAQYWPRDPLDERASDEQAKAESSGGDSPCSA